jgi:signal transduction histidine kinase
MQFRTEAREIRILVTEATNSVRRQLFALRDKQQDYQAELIKHASPLRVQINGDVCGLSEIEKRILSEIVKNASDHSKGHNVFIDLTEHQISVQDDGQGMYGVSELVDEIGGEMRITSNKSGTKVEIKIP